MMQTKTVTKSGLVRPKLILGLILCLLGFGVGAIGLIPSKSKAVHGLMLRAEKLDLTPRTSLPVQMPPADLDSLPSAPSGITFGHPVISGIGGTGFEQSIRIDPSNPNRIYTSTPGTASADTSWIWNSRDGGKTFKWVAGAAPFEGKVTTCHGGGDTEIAVDGLGRLYFNDLTLANFSTARSDDFGVSFTCNNTSVPDVVVDRQWYAIDGDPLNGGSVYLTNDEVGQGAPVCGSTPGNNVLVMYRSPIASAAATTAGILFGPPNKITGLNGCDEGIMGNAEVSPIATTLGQPDGLGGFATLPSPVSHVFVVHDNATFNKIFVARCFPVAFGAPLANVSDPSGLNCTDITVADLGVNAKTGGDFPTLAIDRVGNLYAVWEEAPLTGGVISGDVVLKYSYSTDQGNTWSAPIPIPNAGSAVGTLHMNVFAWINAGDDGRVNIAWYGTNGTAPGGAHGPDDCSSCDWSLWLTQSTNAHDPSPTFTIPILASEHFIHRGTVQTLIGGQNQLSSRSLGDFMQMRVGPHGEANIAYADSNNNFGSAVAHAMYVRQNSGSGLFVAQSPVSLPGLAPFNSVNDAPGDAEYEAGGMVSLHSIDQLDIRSSSIAKTTDAPCSLAAPCYQVSMQLNNLSLTAPNPTDDPDTDLVWLTQWFVPSSTDPNGGKDFMVYAEANAAVNGGALQCFAGENAVELIGGGAAFTYPGTTTLPAANCQSTLGPNGTIVIYVPLSVVTEADPIDNRLHEVTASTMTLSQPANTNPPVAGIGGSFFNLIDVAQGYIFDPTVLEITNITRLVNGHIVLDCLGATNYPNTIEYSPDLVTPFTKLDSVVAGPTGVFQYEDAAATGLTRRFYRLSLP